MDEIKLYPYRIRVTDPVEIEIFNRVSNQRFAKIKPNMAKRVRHKIPRKIKRDGIIIKDGLFTIYNPKITLDINPAYGGKKGIDVTFKTVF